MTEAEQIAVLQKHVAELHNAIYTLIAWMATSANSPINRDDAIKLLAMLDAMGDR